MTKLSIIILSYNTTLLITRCIEFLTTYYSQQIKSGEFEIIVVDNASGDESVKLIKNSFPEIKIIENKENYGFSKGCNIGAKRALGKYLFFLNSDTEVREGLQKMVSYFDSNEQLGILGAKMTNTDGSPQRSAGKFYNLVNVFFMLFGGEKFGMQRLSPKKLTEVDWVSGAAMMIRKDLFDKLQGFDENFFMYIEDIEICFRVRKRGYTISFFPDIDIVHGEQGSSNRSFAILNIYKGLLYFYKKHKSNVEYTIVKLMLFMKAYVAIFIGIFTQNKYLVITYKKAISFYV